ncbi:hypothetical protein FS749_013525 [Ceratobasidium sp. UAMH 11750]|nr:hypothetical protein FS749_013525 [Ceratobasidium sp. UAMH 11750]
MFVVYITHNMSSTGGYQLNHTTSLLAPEFFERTLAPATSIMQRAKAIHAFLICCGHVFESSSHTRAMQQWLNK